MKPLSVKWMIALNYLKIVLGILLIFAIILMVLGLQDWDFAEGVLETLAKKIDKPTFNSTYLLGYFLGFMIILILISLLEIYLIRIQKRTGFWITFALDFLITISSSFIFILFPITLLILGLSKSARSYFNKDIYLMAESD